MINPIPSPFKYPQVTEEVLEMVKKMTGAASVFIIVSSDGDSHICEDSCQGHQCHSLFTGFSGPQILGAIDGFVEDCGFKLTPIDESEE